jgi:hypothetical protein
LLLKGRVVHSDERSTAVQILRYAFGRGAMNAIRGLRSRNADAFVA